jgi:thioredoxin reductase
MFIFIGALPRTDWLAKVVERDERGFILTGPDLMRDGQRPKGWTLDRDPFVLETNVPGIFAVGDVRHGSVKRVASGVGEGSVAVQFIHRRRSIGLPPQLNYLLLRQHRRGHQARRVVPQSIRVPVLRRDPR